MEFTYYAKKIEQWPGAPAFYVMDVKAHELLNWASVPRATDGQMEGFQRPLNSGRAEKITSFMERNVNHIIPGTIIVTSDKSTGLGADSEIKVTPLEVGGVDPETHNMFEITFEYEELGSLDMLNQIITDFDSRMGDNERQCALLEYELGTDERNESHMSNFVKKLREIHENWDDLDPDVKDEWQNYIRDNHKIAYIMDGQHRVEGAAGMNPVNCDHLDFDDECVLSVTLIPDLEVAEQVFHFAMMNMTPEKVKQEQAQNNATTSLTNEEFGEYEERIDGFINTNDTQWMGDLNRLEISPFRGRIQYQYLGGDANYVKANVLNQIQQNWKKDKPIRSNLYTHREHARSWLDDAAKDSADGFRFNTFCHFWRIISEKFPDAWEDANSNLWKKVALWTLQQWCQKEMSESFDLLIRIPEAGGGPLNSIDSLSYALNFVLDRLPSDFYDLEWRVVEDTGTGRSDLIEQMDRQKGRNNVSRAHGNLFIRRAAE